MEDTVSCHSSIVDKMPHPGPSGMLSPHALIGWAARKVQLPDDCVAGVKESERRRIVTT